MANWCEGVLKIRGDRKDIIRFLRDGIISCGIWGDKRNYKVDVGKLYKESGYQCVKIITEEGDYYWIKGLRRAQIYIDNDIEFYGYDNQVICFYLEQAWDIDTQGLANISKKFNLDLKIYGFERGMEFNRDIKIINGEIIKDDTIDFKDYDWDCINPLLGG